MILTTRSPSIEDLEQKIIKEGTTSSQFHTSQPT